MGVDGETSGPCSGDNGAPLINMKNGKLVGIVTTRFVSTSCDDEDYPGLFTSVHFYRDWIDSHIKKFSCPWFDTIKYPTSAPSFTTKPSPNPSIVPSMNPTTSDPTLSSSSSPTSALSVFPTFPPTKYVRKSQTKKKTKGEAQTKN